MNARIALLLPILFLTACTNMHEMAYDVTMDIEEEDQRTLVTEQAVEVMQRRLDSMGVIHKQPSIRMTDGGARISIEAESAEALEELTRQLQTPFSLKIMAQAGEGETPEITVENHGGFVSTGISGDDLLWVEGGMEPGKQTGQVILEFTEEGRAKMADLFRRMVGQNIGIFVRDQLISKLQVDTDELKDDIVIRDIPSAELADIFADDVNVGIHVTFTPVP